MSDSAISLQPRRILPPPALCHTFQNGLEIKQIVIAADVSIKSDHSTAAIRGVPFARIPDTGLPGNLHQ
jgi:hypothetical protein